MTAPTWSDAVELCRLMARADLQRADVVRPTVLGFAGEDLLAMVELRPHADGEYERPLIEALALLLPLGSDRLAYLVSGRAWSLDDPIPPVCGDVDLRQTIVAVMCLDHHDRADVGMSSVLFPFSRSREGQLIWNPPVTIDGDGEGPVAHILATLVRDGPSEGEPLEMGRQALRLLRLGHDLGVPAGDTADPRLARCLLLATESERRGDPQPDWTDQSWS